MTPHVQITSKNFKRIATRAQARLAEYDGPVTYEHMLEVLSAGFGEPSWNAMSRVLGGMDGEASPGPVASDTNDKTAAAGVCQFPVSNWGMCDEPLVRQWLTGGSGVDIIIGRSTHLMNAGNLASYLNSSSPQCRISILGMGKGSTSGLCQTMMLRSRSADVMHRNISFAANDAVNPFDTEAGCREPGPLARAAMLNTLVLMTIHKDLSHVLGMPDLLSHALDLAFLRLSDLTPEGTPRTYAPGLAPLVDSALDELFIRTEDRTWWQVADDLFAAGQVKASRIAQRYAVPRLYDIVEALNSPEIHNIFGSPLMPNRESLVQACHRSLTYILRACPSLCVVTALDVSDARVAAIDVPVMIGNASETSRLQALLWLLARHALHIGHLMEITAVMDCYLPEELVDGPQYRKWHGNLRKLRQGCPVRLSFSLPEDALDVVREQVTMDGRECRKWGVHLVIQTMARMSRNLLSLAGNVFLSAMTAMHEQNMMDILDMSQESAKALGGLAEPTALEATYMRSVSDGAQAAMGQVIFVVRYDPLDAWYLTDDTWDMALRDSLARKTTFTLACTMLADMYPLGTARSDMVMESEVNPFWHGQFNKMPDSEVMRVVEAMATRMLVPNPG